MAYFLGVLLLSGYHSLPEEDHYWSNSEDLAVNIVSSSMSRAQFRNVKRNLHFADNQKLPAGDKVAKVAPIYSTVNITLMKFGVFHHDLSIDESMIPYYGHHSAKQYIRGKPIGFGYKVWCLCGADGYPYRMKIYTGKEANGQATPLGTRVVTGMIDAVREHLTVSQHHVFFDNFFTSHSLLSLLAKDGVKATGTIRENRTGGANKDLKSSKDMKKLDRGTYDYRCDGTVFVCKWNDNHCVSWQQQPHPSASSASEKKSEEASKCSCTTATPHQSL